MPSAERVEPLTGEERFLDGPLLTAWWAALSIGGPALLIGMHLAHPDGLGLSLGQIILLVPIGALIAGGLAALIAALSAAVGVPFGLLIRPTLGIGLGAAVGLVRAALYVAVMAWQMSLLLEVGRATFGEGSALVALVVLVVAAVVLFVIGVDSSIRYFIRWPAFWGGIFVAFGILWRLSGLSLGFATTPSAGFWMGVDEFVWLVVLLAPLIVDTARMVDHDDVAPTAVAFGFSVPTVLVVVGGASLAAATGLNGIAGLAALFGAGGALVLILASAWVLFAEIDQAFSAAFSAELEIATLTDAVPRMVTGSLLVAGGGALAWFGSHAALGAAVEWGVRLLAPVVAAILADYFLVRHARYETDDLFKSQGEYPLVNLVGVLAWLTGLAIAEWLDPVVFASLGWTSGLGDVPATLAGMAAAAVVYWIVGRLLVREQVYVADVRV